MKTKKGIALNQAFGAVLVLVLLAVLVIVAILLFVSLGDTFVALATASAVNESADFTTANSVNLDNSTLCNVDRFAISLVVNASGDTINAPNYSVTSTGVLTNLTGEFPVEWFVTDSSVWGGASCDANAEMITQFATYPALVGLVGTIIFLGLVIGVLVASFVFGGKGV